MAGDLGGFIPIVNYASQSGGGPIPPINNFFLLTDLTNFLLTDTTDLLLAQ